MLPADFQTLTAYFRPADSREAVPIRLMAMIALDWKPATNPTSDWEEV